MNKNRIIAKDQPSGAEFPGAVGLASASAGAALLLPSCAPAATLTLPQRKCRLAVIRHIRKICPGTSTPDGGETLAGDRHPAFRLLRQDQV
jgi:hypothetical protein